MKIRFLFRKKQPSQNSIEELFWNLENTFSKNYDVEGIQVPYAGASPFILWKNCNFFRREAYTVYHITGDIHYMSVVTGKNSVLTIHDVKSIIYGNILRKTYLFFFWFLIPSLFQKKITVISEFSKTELIKLIPWAKKKIVVVHNPLNTKVLKYATGLFDSPNPKSGIFKILLMGTKPNKNLIRTLEALSVFPCELIIVGALKDEHKESLNRYGLLYDNFVNITFEEVIKCYQKCDLVCFASTYEGFGMPIIEAQAMGKPVVTSNVASMPEIAAESAIQVDPFSVESIRKGVSSLLFDEKLRIEKIKQGYINIERFRIENIAQKYIEIYKEILNDK